MMKLSVENHMPSLRDSGCLGRGYLGLKPKAPSCRRSATFLLRMELLENKDGSITIYIGPDKPEGDKAKN